SMALRLLARQRWLITHSMRCYAAGADFLRDVPLKNRDGNVNVDDLKDKAIILYFSAGWCPHCRLFTPKLKKWYESAAKKEGVEIVWISRDREADHLLEYYEKALPNVPYVPFGDKHIKEFLEKYSVKTIPQARLVDSKGKVVEAEARNRIQEEGKADAQKLARTFVDMV
uniref:protein-disulfide reductase n=2 Tax=Parascaris univalens TaxID=6257 RepID=A0A914ZPN4_PARUN